MSEKRNLLRDDRGLTRVMLRAQMVEDCERKGKYEYCRRQCLKEIHTSRIRLVVRWGAISRNDTAYCKVCLLGG